MSTSAVAVPKTDLHLQHVGSPQTVIGRFVARRALRSAVLWAVVFGGYVASKAIGFVAAYPTEAARQKAAALFSNNTGIEMLLGKAPHNATTDAYVAWNTLSVMVLIGGIWAFLLATKYFRGEEDAGRWEIMLAGQTTARRAAASALIGLAISLSVFYVILATLLTMVGRARGLDFSTSSALYFALAATAGTGIFMGAGAFASQLMPIRSRAISMTAGFFGLAFLLRAIGDITGVHWLLYLTPIGWVEKLQPLAGSQPLWLLPIFALIILLGVSTIFLAGRRDLGEGILTDNDTSKPHTGLLNSPLSAALRFTRTANLAWLTAIGAGAVLFGLLTKSATQAFSQSAGAAHLLNRLSHQSQSSGITAFLGIVFFLQMLIIMAYAASSVSAIRRDEAEGYLDNFLVRPVSRQQWLWGRLSLLGAGILMAGLLTSVGTWIGLTSQHTSLSFHTLFLASSNAVVPVIVTVGFGVFAFGFCPRFTGLVAYGVLAWSFLIEMVSSGINLSHWVLDTSVLHHIALAPAAAPDWGSGATLVGIGVLLCVAGALRFNSRDLTGE